MYRYFVGDTRGWVEVKRSELEEANILSLISTCSYERGDYVYLDEDIDLSFFMYYLGEIPNMHEIYVNDDYFSNYKKYRGGLQ